PSQRTGSRSPDFATSISAGTPRHYRAELESARAGATDQDHRRALPLTRSATGDFSPGTSDKSSRCLGPDQASVPLAVPALLRRLDALFATLSCLEREAGR